MNKVLVGGCFDIFHFGHLSFLQKAKEAGDYLVVALESDETVKKLKGIHRPVHTQKQRAELLRTLRMVDEVIELKPMNGYDDYLDLVKKVKPNVLAITTGDTQKENKEKMAKEIGASVLEISLIPEFSTTSTITELLNTER